MDIDSIANSEESALLTWLLLFLVRLQAKFYLPETAVNCLLKFLYIFLTIISRNSTFVARMIKNFPTSTFLLKKYICSKETLVRYVVCRQCYSVYEYDQCLDSTKTSKKCTYRPHPTFHKYCNTQLLKTIHLKGGKKKLIPLKFTVTIRFKLPYRNLCSVQILSIYVNIGVSIIILAQTS